MHIKPMIAAAVLSAGFAAVAMGSVTSSAPARVSASPAAATLRLAADETTKKTKHHKRKGKKTTATDTMSAPK